jgi:hypothetical protein
MDSHKILVIGKYKGMTFNEIRNTDVAYCNWVLRQMGTIGHMKEFQEWLKSISKKTTCEACNGTGQWHTM